VAPRRWSARRSCSPTTIAKLSDMQAAYSGMLYDNGTFVDDVIGLPLSTPRKFLVVVNGANVAK